MSLWWSMSDKVEIIGKVKLDSSFCSAADEQSEERLDDLLDIVKNTDPHLYMNKVIEKGSWPLLYHLSETRENLINWIPVSKNDRVLEIGAECGALTGVLCEKAHTVCSIDASYKSCLVNAYRHKDYENLEIIAGDHKEVIASNNESYDLIILVGGSLLSKEMLESVKEHITETGRIVIAVDNKIGLKYLAGSLPDGTARYTKSELESLFVESGFTDYSFYYPYPDMLFTNSVYSDDYLPHKGDLTENARNFDKCRYVFWDESEVFDDVIDNNSFPAVSNSYLVILGSSGDDRIIYAKESDNRDPKYQIITTIHSNSRGLAVKKTNRRTAGSDHIKSICRNENLLDSVTGDRAAVCKSVQRDDVLETKFVEGVNLESDFNKACKCGSSELIYKSVDKLYDLIRCMKTSDVFVQDDKFQTVFGNQSVPENVESGNVVDVDLVFSNVIQTDDKDYIIDCEWVFDFLIPLEYVLWRALFYSRAFSEVSDQIKENVYDRYGLSSDKRDIYLKMEEAFQRYIAGDEVKLSDYIKAYPPAIKHIDYFVAKEKENEELKHTNEELRHTLDDILNSKSWRLLKKLGIVKG